VNGSAAVLPLVETMMALDPQRRYQTPSQLLEAVRQVRADLTWGGGNAKPAAPAPRPVEKAAPAGPTIFIVENDERLQDAMRDKFKKLGYRVLLAGTPARAADRYAQQPYAGLIVDIGTTGEDGLRVFKDVLQQARDKKLACGGVAIFSEDQVLLRKSLDLDAGGITVLTRPVTLNQLTEHLQTLVPLDGKANGS
jgi:CheY-like chemotaxis protein